LTTSRTAQRRRHPRIVALHGENRKLLTAGSETRFHHHRQCLLYGQRRRFVFRFVTIVNAYFMDNVVGVCFVIQQLLSIRCRNSLPGARSTRHVTRALWPVKAVYRDSRSIIWTKSFVRDIPACRRSRRRLLSAIWPRAAKNLRRKRREASFSKIKAYKAVDHPVCGRVRHFLARRHKVPNRGTRRFSSDMIFGELGVLALDYRRGPHNEASRKAGCGKSARLVYDGNALAPLATQRHGSSSIGGSHVRL
jgi:hypothetical protein